MLKLSTYSLKTGFQALLTPLRDLLIKLSVSPNALTLFTCSLCILYAFLLQGKESSLFLIIFPLFLFLRMALNALDGMIASHTQQKTALGSVLNEVCDIVSDVFLFGAFIYLLPIKIELWIILIAFIFLLEFTSLAIFQAIAIRPYAGPFGKSDRAVFLGVVAVALLIFPNASTLFMALSILGIILTLLTLFNRIKLLSE